MDRPIILLGYLVLLVRKDSLVGYEIDNLNWTVFIFILGLFLFLFLLLFFLTKVMENFRYIFL